MEVAIQLTDEEAANVEAAARAGRRTPSSVVAQFVRSSPAWQNLLHGDEYQHRGFIARVREPEENC